MEKGSIPYQRSSGNFVKRWSEDRATRRVSDIAGSLREGEFHDRRLVARVVKGSSSRHVTIEDVDGRFSSTVQVSWDPDYGSMFMRPTVTASRQSLVGEQPDGEPETFDNTRDPDLNTLKLSDVRHMCEQAARLQAATGVARVAVAASAES